ncbi:MAG: hypothetical protein U0599_03925 [Vicinamibacteria bacterium]
MTRTSVTLPFGWIVNVTPIGCEKPALICWFQSIQIFWVTPAMYRSPPVLRCRRGHRGRAVR